IIFTWNGSQIVMCTSKNAPKLQALSENPMVALTIDTEVHPPKILLIRGRAELDFVDGIPDEYLQATSTYEMTPEQRVEWEAEVRSLYHNGMVWIVVTPNRAKLIDFETTLPSAVEELVRSGRSVSAPEHRAVARIGWIAHASTPPRYAESVKSARKLLRRTVRLRHVQRGRGPGVRHQPRTLLRRDRPDPDPPGAIRLVGQMTVAKATGYAA
ncbi:hypothetical protein, partial [Candidatus Dormiibacter inghamiae]